MFSACTHSILNSFCVPTSNVRVVIATIAFGMGLVFLNVRRVFQWGPSGDIERIYKKLVVQVKTCFLLKQFCTMVGKALLPETDDNMKEYCANRDIHCCSDLKETFCMLFRRTQLHARFSRISLVPTFMTANATPTYGRFRVKNGGGGRIKLAQNRETLPKLE